MDIMDIIGLPGFFTFRKPHTELIRHDHPNGMLTLGRKCWVFYGSFRIDVVLSKCSDIQLFDVFFGVCLNSCLFL